MKERTRKDEKPSFYPPRRNECKTHTIFNPVIENDRHPLSRENPSEFGGAVFLN
jgi:hypothetical protein